MYGFRWLRKAWNFLVTRSDAYKKLSDELKVTKTRLNDKESVSDGPSVEYSMELTELRMALEKVEDQRNYASLQVKKLRRDKIEMERIYKTQLEEVDSRNKSLTLKIENLRNYAFSGLEGVLTTFSQAPGFIVSPDLVPTRANDAAIAYFNGKIIGKTFLQMGISEEQQYHLMEYFTKGSGPKILDDSNSPLNGWGMVPVRDENGKPLACLFTSEKELVKKIVTENRGFFRTALEVLMGSKELDRRGIRIRDDLTVSITDPHPNI